MAQRTVAARGKFREWWPEIALGAFITFVGLCFIDGTTSEIRDSAFALGFTVFMIALGWWMGHRHRRLPMQATLDGTRQEVREVRDIIVNALAEPEPDTASWPVPDLRVVE